MSTERVHAHTHTHTTHAHTHTPQNSIRHSLSLGQYFRKVDRKHGKKGFHWEVAAKKKAALDKEIEHFMKQEGLEMTSTHTGRW